ncbi:zinc-ribbon domain-containing protein [Streptomyces sp. P38-E01]|uniref:Zinc-ribbon domain-containing protein n=1 Tax=Streptomyces tardus TaxID=2780544 RepID=A0A949N8B1_9ACTN|nr:zinc-ribbon domain-containing protein [Streptomyces tardus]
MLTEATELLAEAAEQQGGALWNLAVRQRQLDANLIRLPAGAEVAAHTEPDLDVLLVVFEGEGRLTTVEGEQALTRGAVAWLAHGTERALVAGSGGLAYFTVHRRRPGMSIGRPSGGRVEEEGGEAACLLQQVCPECGRPATERTARFCARCGTELPAD